ncbi:MAG: zinc-ribbon domain-containing protein, partial [Nitrospinaceae bacterium]|nr:zinc-ribbon domain-containing protein [Nitrospinaceae bacterium]
MKIFCTHCQAGYQVDLPDIKPAGVKFKCAKCQQKFLVKPQGADQVQENVSSQATAAAGATGALPDEGDSDMPEDEKQPETTDTGDDELDDFLDDLLNEDENKEGEETPADSTSEENEEETTGEETTETVAEESEKTETATPDEDIPPEEASEEDLWAQAFADQDAVEEG